MRSSDEPLLWFADDAQRFWRSKRLCSGTRDHRRQTSVAVRGGSISSLGSLARSTPPSATARGYLADGPLRPQRARIRRNATALRPKPARRAGKVVPHTHEKRV